MALPSFLVNLGKRIRFLNSFLTGIRIASYNSPLNGILEVWMIDGKLVLNSKKANQSYDSLHKIFREVFKRIEITKNPPAGILLLGTGAGSVISILREELNIQAHVDAVEHDPLMLEIAEKYFGITRFPDVSFMLQDASTFVKTTSETYNLIVVDLFNDDQVPLRFYEEAFHEQLLRIFSKGFIVFNCITRDISHLNRFEKLRNFYNYHPGLIISSYNLLEDNDVMVVEKKF